MYRLRAHPKFFNSRRDAEAPACIIRFEMEHEKEWIHHMKIFPLNRREHMSQFSAQPILCY